MKKSLMVLSSLMLFSAGTVFAQADLAEIEPGIVELENGELGVTHCGAVLKHNGKTYKLQRDLTCPGVSHSCPTDELTGCKNRAVVTIAGRDITFLFNHHTISIEPRTSTNTNLPPALRRGYDTIVWSTGSHNTIIGSTATSYGPNPSSKSADVTKTDMHYAPQSTHSDDALAITGIRLGSSHHNHAASLDAGHNKVFTVGCSLSQSGTCFQVGNSHNYLFGNKVASATIGFHVGIPESDKTTDAPIIHSNKLEQNNVAAPNAAQAFLLTSQLPAHMLDNLDVYNVYIYNEVSDTEEGFSIKNGSGNLLIKNLAYLNSSTGFNIEKTHDSVDDNHRKNFLIANDTDDNPNGIHLSNDVKGTVVAFNIALRNNEDIHNAVNDPNCKYNDYILNWANPEKVNFSCVLNPLKDQKLFAEIETIMNKY